MSLQTLNRGKGVLRIQLPASLGGPLGGPQEGRRGEQGCAGCSSSFPTLPSPSSVFFFFGKKRASGFRRPQHLLSPFVDQSRAQARPPRLLRPRAAARSAGRCWGSSRRFLAGGPAAAPARRDGGASRALSALVSPRGVRTGLLLCFPGRVSPWGAIKVPTGTADVKAGGSWHEEAWRPGAALPAGLGAVRAGAARTRATRRLWRLRGGQGRGRRAGAGGLALRTPSVKYPV